VAETGGKSMPKFVIERELTSAGKLSLDNEFRHGFPSGFGHARCVT